MSRIGKLPVVVPDSVKVNVTGHTVLIEGPKGKLTKTFNDVVTIKVVDNQILVEPRNNSRLARAMHGTARSIINNMVTGVLTPYSKDLVIDGVGFRAAVKGSVVDLNLGYSHPINHPIPENVTVAVSKDNARITVTGCDKALVGKVAADIKAYYPVEPYKGKGIRIVGEFVKRKEGKKTA